MKFYLYREQEGGGCDYTIGCGAHLAGLDATDAEAARSEVEAMMADPSESWAGGQECAISGALILSEVSDVMDLVSVAAEREANRTREYVLANKRKQLAALKAELGE